MNSSTQGRPATRDEKWLDALAGKIVYTGPIDACFGYEYGDKYYDMDQVVKVALERSF